jgi:hypothetical protein
MESFAFFFSFFLSSIYYTCLTEKKEKEQEIEKTLNQDYI